MTIDGPPGLSTVADSHRPAMTLAAAISAVNATMRSGVRGQRTGGDGRDDQEGHDQQDADDLHGDGDGDGQQHVNTLRTNFALDALGGGQLLVHARRSSGCHSQATTASTTAPPTKMMATRYRSRRRRRRTGTRSGRPARP